MHEPRTIYRLAYRIKRLVVTITKTIIWHHGQLRWNCCWIIAADTTATWFCLIKSCFPNHTIANNRACVVGYRQKQPRLTMLKIFGNRNSKLLCSTISVVITLQNSLEHNIMLRCNKLMVTIFVSGGDKSAQGRGKSIWSTPQNTIN